MASVSLQFQAARDPALAIALLVTVAAVLIGWGVRQVLCRRRRYGAFCIAAGAFGAIGSAGIILTDSGGLWMALLAAQVALAVGAFYYMVYGHLGRGRLVGLMALRCGAILALMLLLFKPALSVAPEADGDKPELAILLDRSGSMATADDTNLPDRYRQCAQMLQAQAPRIERSFAPQWYAFAKSAGRAESADALADMTAGGKGADGTDLAAAIRTAANARRLAGIVILTDGIHNASASAIDAAVEARVPIYTVAVGTTSDKLAARRNIELLATDAPLEAVVNNVTKLTASVRVAGFATVPTEVDLYTDDGSSPGGAPADSRRLWTDKNVATLQAELKWTPRDAAAGGAGRIRKLRIVAAGNPAEASADDNAAELHVLLTEPGVRVLYIEGSIRPEYKFLKRLLMGDPNIRFLSLVRVAGNRFWAQGGAGAARLDHLPETPEDFKLFDVIIIGDLDRTFLTREQMAMLRSFVNDGGGLLMLGGHNSFGPGGYGGADVEAVLPVLCGPRSQPQETTPFIPRLTAAGETHAIFQGVAPFFFGPGGRKPDEHLPKLANLLGCVTVPSTKPGASVLAIHPTRQIDGKQLVVLAVQRVGAGRSAAFTADTTWQWDAPMRGMGRESPYERLWGQMIRWLANVETKSRESAPAVMIRPDRSFVRIGQGSVKVLALVQDDRGRAADNAQVTLTVTPVGPAGKSEADKAESLPMSPRSGERLFEAEYRPSRDGRFTLEVSAKDSTGKALGSDAQPLTVLPFSAETDRLGRDDALLEELAERTRGRKVDLPALPELIDQITQRLAARGQATRTRQASIVPLFNFPLLFLAFVALLTTEWMLRRRWHLR